VVVPWFSRLLPPTPTTTSHIELDGIDGNRLFLYVHPQCVRKTMQPRSNGLANGIVRDDHWLVELCAL
jgi:hypothetical protein